MAHEGYHAQDNATLAPFISQTIGALENEIPSGQPVTTLLVTYASVLLADEANANLSGWNAAVGTLPQAKFGQKAGPTAADLSAIATESVRIGISNARPVQGCPQPLRVTGLMLRPSLGAAWLAWKIWPPVGFCAEPLAVAGPPSQRAALPAWRPRRPSLQLRTSGPLPARSPVNEIGTHP